MSRTGRKIKPSVCGFTLIELLFVAAITLALVGLAAPRLARTFSELEIKNASLNLYQIFQFAQQRAVVERKPFKIAFNFGGGRYQLLESLPGAPGENDSFGPPSGRFGRSMTVPPRAVLSGQPTEILFYPDGSSNGGEISLTRPGDTGYQFTLKGSGAGARMQEIAA